MAKGHGQAWLAEGICSQPRIAELVAEGRIVKKKSYTSADRKALRAMLQEARALNNATAGDEDNETAIQSLSRNPERIAKIKLIVERTAKIKLERELLAGGYLKKEDVERDLQARVYSVRAKMQELPLRAALIANRSEAECEGIIESWVKEICEHYSSGGN